MRCVLAGKRDGGLNVCEAVLGESGELGEVVAGGVSFGSAGLEGEGECIWVRQVKYLSRM